MNVKKYSKQNIIEPKKKRKKKKKGQQFFGMNNQVNYWAA